MLERPRLTDDTFLKSGELSVYDQIYVNALLHHIKKSFPDEDLLREIIISYANKSLERSNDWLVYSKILLFKSLAEDKKSKFVERSLLQIQSLCDQYNDRNPTPYNRLKNYFYIDYPFIWNLRKIYAEAFMNFGAVLTAFDIFQDLHMYEECIQCLYVAGKNQKAQEFAENILKTNPEPGIYCVIGEIQNDEKLFFKALEVSNNKYTRAYRCLGKFYSAKNEIDEAIKYYEKALEINPLFPNIWFAIGCLYLRKKDWPNASRSFSKSVQIDESNSESWANLGLAFAQMNKNKEALKCLEEGYKRSRTNWRICENLVLLAIDCQDLNRLIIAINNMFNLDKHERIRPDMFYKMVKIYLNSCGTFNEKQKDYFKEKIYSIFERFSMKDGVTPEIWDLYALFIESVEIENSKESITEEETGLYYKAIMEIRMKQARTYMIPEWEKSDKAVETLKNLVETKIKPETSRLKDADYVNEINFFVQNIETKIEKFYKMKELEGNK